MARRLQRPPHRDATRS